MSADALSEPVATAPVASNRATSGPATSGATFAGAAITGLGAVSAIGLDVAAMAESLRAARGGIDRIGAFSTEGLRVHHAGELRGWRAAAHFPPDVARRLDRTAQLAVVAARQAVADAALPGEALRSGRVGVVFGICGGGIGAPDGPGIMAIEATPTMAAGSGDGPAAAAAPGRAEGAEREVIERFLATTPYAQTAAVAADLGIAGPCLTVSTACAASTSALAAALTLLRAGRCDAVVVGGADAWSLGTYAGFYALGAMSEQPCSPFSRDTGVTFGEGAGCIVIETHAAAQARGAHMHGILLGCGATADAHHITAPNPGGQGLLRAMQLALRDAGVAAEAVGYINAHGTGTPDNDVAEAVAIRRLFGGAAPPVSSSKSFFGHTLGAAGILEFIASLLGMQAGFLPPTLNFAAPRPGCDLDCVPNAARPADFDIFLSLSAAFGGVNAVAVGAKLQAARLASPPGPAVRAASPRSANDAVVTGIGVVSPVGFGAAGFREALLRGSCGIAPITRFPTTGLTCRAAALMGEFPARRLAPAADPRRMDALTRFAVVAATLALKDAGLTGKLPPERIGLHVALGRGPVGSAQIFAEELARGGVAGLGAKFFPPIVYATIGGQIGQSCQIRGASFTTLDGAGAGLQALTLADLYLREHDELDALVVVAADETAPMVYYCLDRLGLLAPGGLARPYAADGEGYVVGEGGVALVIERADFAARRGARGYGRIAGAALGGEGRDDEAVDPRGAVLAEMASQALAGDGGAAPDVVYGLARGAACHDAREANGLRRVLGNAPVPVSSLNGQLGLAEATCGLYAAAAALLGLRHGEIYPSMAAAAVDGLDIVRDTPREVAHRRALVLGSSQHGNSAAILLREAA